MTPEMLLLGDEKPRSSMKKEDEIGKKKEGHRDRGRGAPWRED